MDQSSSNNDKKSLEILAGVVSRTNFEKVKGNGKSSATSSSSSSSSKVPGPIRKHTSSTLPKSSLKDESVTAKSSDSKSTGGMCLPTGSYDVKEVAVSRVSCHRCGNIRKNKLQCTRNMCPYIFCGKCVERMQEEHGQNAFDDGCPVCKELCCCTNKTINCDRKNHCYRKCPASKHSHKQANGRHSSVGGISGVAKHPMPSWNYVGIPHQFLPNPAMYYGSHTQYPFPPQAIMPNNFMGGFLPASSEENSSAGTNEVDGNGMGNVIGPVSAISSSSMTDAARGPMINQGPYSFSLVAPSASSQGELDTTVPVPSVAAEDAKPLFESTSSSSSSSIGPEGKKARIESLGGGQGYPVHGFPPHMCMGMMSDYYLDDSRVPVPAPGREQFQLPMSMPFQLPNFGGVPSNSSVAPSSMTHGGRQFPFPMPMNMNNMEPHQVAAYNKVVEGAMMNQANQLHSFSQFFQAHQLHAQQQQQQQQQYHQQQYSLQQQAHQLKMGGQPSPSPSQQILQQLAPQQPTQSAFQPSQFSDVAAEEFASGDNNGLNGHADYPVILKKPDIVGADEVLSGVETAVYGSDA